MKILIVDDNQELAFTIRVMLEEEGFEVRLANDGQDGYWAFLEFKPDWVLTDIQMPGENGLELMEHIRNHNPMVKTIYMSGNLESYWTPLQKEIKRYPVSILEKPFSKVELMGCFPELAPDKTVKNSGRECTK